MLNSRSRAALREAARRLHVEASLDRIYRRLDVLARRDALDRRSLDLLLAFCLREDSNCVDVGAHSGVVLAEMVRRAPRGKHIAYEPLPHLAAQLAEAYPQVDVRSAAVSDEEGEATFFHVREEPEGSGLKPRDWKERAEVEELRVRVDRLDSALSPDYVPHLIKIDVEGAEGQVIAGAMTTLTRHRPIVVFEHGLGGSDYYGNYPARIYDLLVGQAGMRIFDLDGRGPYTPAGFEAVFTQPIWNFVALP
jgi:FkbM family methyltransferase